MTRFGSYANNREGSKDEKQFCKVVEFLNNFTLKDGGHISHKMSVCTCVYMVCVAVCTGVCVTQLRESWVEL